MAPACRSKLIKLEAIGWRGFRLCWRCSSWTWWCHGRLYNLRMLLQILVDRRRRWAGGSVAVAWTRSGARFCCRGGLWIFVTFLTIPSVFLWRTLRCCGSVLQSLLIRCHSWDGKQKRSLFLCLKGSSWKSELLKIVTRHIMCSYYLGHVIHFYTYSSSYLRDSLPYNQSWMQRRQVGSFAPASIESRLTTQPIILSCRCNGTNDLDSLAC